MASDDEVIQNMIRSAKDALAFAQLEVVRKQNWLKGLEAEYEEIKRRRVLEARQDPRTLLNG